MGIIIIGKMKYTSLLLFLGVVSATSQ